MHSRFDFYSIQSRLTQPLIKGLIERPYDGAKQEKTILGWFSEAITGPPQVGLCQYSK
jgi:hypothetical protein